MKKNNQSKIIKITAAMAHSKWMAELLEKLSIIYPHFIQNPYIRLCSLNIVAHTQPYCNTTSILSYVHIIYTGRCFNIQKYFQNIKFLKFYYTIMPKILLMYPYIYKLGYINFPYYSNKIHFKIVWLSVSYEYKSAWYKTKLSRYMFLQIPKQAN